jgi:hypothetical protein
MILLRAFSQPKLRAAAGPFLKGSDKHRTEVARFRAMAFTTERVPRSGPSLTTMISY